VVGPGIGPHSASMPMWNTLDDGQPDTGTLELFLGMKPLKNAKQLLVVLHIESGAVVAHKIDDLVSLLTSADLDDGISLTAGVFNGVGEQIRPNMAHGHAIGKCWWQCGPCEIDVPAVLLLPQFVPDAVDEVFHGDRPLHKFPSTEA